MIQIELTSINIGHSTALTISGDVGHTCRCCSFVGVASSHYILHSS